MQPNLIIEIGKLNLNAEKGVEWMGKNIFNEKRDNGEATYNSKDEARNEDVSHYELRNEVAQRMDQN